MCFYVFAEVDAEFCFCVVSVGGDRVVIVHNVVFKFPVLNQLGRG